MYCKYVLESDLWYIYCAISTSSFKEIVVPSYVKFAQLYNSLFAPTVTILLAVKSLNSILSNLPHGASSLPNEPVPVVRSDVLPVTYNDPVISVSPATVNLVPGVIVPMPTIPSWSPSVPPINNELVLNVVSQTWPNCIVGLESSSARKIKAPPAYILTSSDRNCKYVLESPWRYINSSISTSSFKEIVVPSYVKFDKLDNSLFDPTVTILLAVKLPTINPSLPTSSWSLNLPLSASSLLNEAVKEPLTFVAEISSTAALSFTINTLSPDTSI